MPNNINAWAQELLTWHSHDVGGVRVPFSPSGGNPLRDAGGGPALIVTGLIERLRKLAEQIASGSSNIRFIFLVGGPGNGKSEAVQDFVHSLDKCLGLNGKLSVHARDAFKPNPLVPWKATLQVPQSEQGPRAIDSLVVIQDASAATKPGSDAAYELVETIVDCITAPAQDKRIFMCCVNRGVLARALAVANQHWASDKRIADLIMALIRATSLGKEALQQDRPPSWPLHLQEGHPLAGQVVSWPLDMESLLLSAADGGLASSPIEQMLANAVDVARWEVPGRCGDCASRTLCPTRQNAEWLRDKTTRNNFLAVLRASELVTGQRWNFRSALSVVAEVVVGDRIDFLPSGSSCEWVHSRVATSGQQGQVRAMFELNDRLTPNALFPTAAGVELPASTRSIAEAKNCLVTLEVNEHIQARLRLEVIETPTRGYLRQVLCRKLDSALMAGQEAAQEIRLLEERYSQSIALGNSAWPPVQLPCTLETVVFGFLRTAEDEWNVLERESAEAATAIRSLRGLACSLAKRSIGVRGGMYTDERYVTLYARAIRDEDPLDEVREHLKTLLGDSRFKFDAMATVGQPTSEEGAVVSLIATTVSVEPIQPAPRSSGKSPAHDLPSFKINQEIMPLTYDLFLALTLLAEGCTASSLPSSVRASIDRIRQLYAGTLCRNQSEFVNRGAAFAIAGTRNRVVIQRLGDAPQLKVGR